MSIGTSTLMALVQTKRKVLKQDSLMSIVSTSGGSIGVNHWNSYSCTATRALLAGCGVARARDP
jgi:hypothetical protein